MKALPVFLIVLLLAGCGPGREVNSDPIMPPAFLWAWERPEDLRFLDPEEYGVAFLAQTLILDREDIIYKPRRQPLQIAPRTYVIAVTRVETIKHSNARPTFSPAQQARLVSLIEATLKLPDVRAVQIDFDAVASERKFYRSMVGELRSKLPPGVPLTMTALASWCVGDAWFDDMPIDEAVPMAFQMGADDEFIRGFLRNGKDWQEPLCRGSYGVAVEEPLDAKLVAGRRLFFFKNSSWTPADLDRLNAVR